MDVPEPDRRSPYQGLDPFEEQDARFFFGRRRESRLIAANLYAAQLTLLYGPSGVGKTSLLNAGAVHELRARDDLLVVTFRRWQREADEGQQGPLLRLKRAIASEAGKLEAGLSAIGDASLGRQLAACAERLDRRIMVVLDQFEEHFLYRAERDPFEAEFASALTELDAPVSFLLSIREDALARLDVFEGRIPNLFDNYLRVEHLDTERAREAVEGPLEEWNLLYGALGDAMAIEPRLVDAVLDEVETGKVQVGPVGVGGVEHMSAPAGADARIETPYLQLVMMKLWDEERKEEHGGRSSLLRASTFADLGGAEGIIGAHVGEALKELSPEEQDVVARLFNHLVTPSRMKIAQRAADLAQYADRPEKETEDILNRLSGPARILRPVGASSYEIFHDSLAAPILDWRQRYVQTRELERQHQVRRQQEEQRQRELREARELAAARRKATLSLAAVVVVLALGLIASGATIVWALRERNRAQDAQALAEAQSRNLSHELARSSLAQLDEDASVATLLAVRAVDAWETREAVDTLRAALLQPLRAVLRPGYDREFGSICPETVFSANGTIVVARGRFCVPSVWDAATGRALELPGRVPTMAGTSVPFSPDGRLVVVSGSGGARLLELRTGRLVTVLGGSPGELSSAVFSRDGSRIVGVGQFGRVHVWDARSGRSLAVWQAANRAIGAEFSPDARRVATRSYGVAQVWETATGKLGANIPMRQYGFTRPVRAAFSPDGRFLETRLRGFRQLWDAATGAPVPIDLGRLRPIFSPDGAVLLAVPSGSKAQLWRPPSRLLAVLPGHRGGVTAAAFSPGGRLVATGAADGAVRVWDVPSGRRTELLRLHAREVRDIAFSPDSRLLLTAGADGAAFVWDLATGRALSALGGHKGALVSASFSPDGKLAVTHGVDGTARLWSLATAGATRVLPSRTAPVLSGASFSADARLLALPDSKGTAIWDVVRGRLASHVDGPGPARGAAFSADGTALVTVASDGVVRVSRVRNGQRIAVLRTRRGSLTAAALSPDGARVVTVGDESGTIVWDVATEKPEAVLGSTTVELRGVVLSPDGRLAVAVGNHVGARVWDVSARRRLRVLQDGESFLSAAFSTNGRLLATTSSDGTVRIWDMATGRRLQRLRGHKRPPASMAFSPNGLLLVTAGDDGTRLWGVRSGLALAVFRGQGATKAAAFRSRGTSIVAAGADGRLRLHTCEPCGPVAKLLELARQRGATPDEPAQAGK
jgi:WD40 repeat protein